MIFKNVNDLNKYINKQIGNVLKNEVAAKVTEVMQEEIKTTVYGNYSPTQYERQYYDGGLLDDDNIETVLVNNNTLVVENTRNDHGRNVAQVVEEGIDYEWTNSQIYKEQPFPRPFTQNTFESLQKSNELKLSMKSGLNKSGIDAR